MRTVHLDLDNTLIYSYRHIAPDSVSCPAVCRKGQGALSLTAEEGRVNGRNWINVEMYQGREISYMTKRSQELLKCLRKKCLVVPTTTRTIEQYKRIETGTGSFEYALVCNGGILLVNGESDRTWYARSRELAADCERELLRGLEMLEKEPLRKFELRFIEELFLFTKCSDPDRVLARLRGELDREKVEVLGNGEKIYVMPKKLDKGTAVRRFREYTGADEVIAAGDSGFDVSMVETADTGIVPAGFLRKYQTAGSIKEMKGEHVFSEEMLSWLLYSS
ncbi:MAG: HAD hydrolase family protein [Dorea sp.]|jgi:hypothetical protein|nr:HAD hydrolase family protein [Dorea sp.]